MAALGAAGPVAFGLVEMRAGVRDAHRQVGQLQQTQARDLAFAIERSLGMVRRQVQAVTALPWTVADQFTADVRRAEFGRLLRLLPVLESAPRRRCRRPPEGDEQSNQVTFAHEPELHVPWR